MPIKQGQYVGHRLHENSERAGLRGTSRRRRRSSGLYFYTFPADGTADTPDRQRASYYLYNADVECGTAGRQPAGDEVQEEEEEGQEEERRRGQEEEKGLQEEEKKKK